MGGLSMKKLLSLTLAAVMALGMTACSSSNGDSSASSSAATSAADGETFKIGGIGPTTGGAAIYGEAVKNGIQIAVDEINAAGGINGYQISYQFQDDENDAEKSVNAYNTLKDWGMQMLVGTTTSTPCVAIAAKTLEDNMFQITPSGSAVKCVEGANAFRVCFSDPDQGRASAEYIGEHDLATKVAVIYDSSDVYSTGIYEKFATEAPNQGIEVVAAEAFTADNKTDFSVQLQKAKDAGAEMLFLPIYYTEASVILSQANSMGYDPIIFGCDGLDGLLGVENFDTSLAEGIMLLTPFAADADDEKTKNFVATYEENYGGIPNQFAADAYDAVYAIKAAAEDAGITPDMSASDICEALKVSMTNITIDGLTSTSTGITWNEAGEPNKEPKAVMIQNGAYTAMDNAAADADTAAEETDAAADASSSAN